MTGDSEDDAHEPPWHERTSTVVGASVAALAAIGLLFLVVSALTPDFGPEPTPQYFVTPSRTSAGATSTTTATRTTITSTVPTVTTDIGPGETTSGSETSSSETLSSESSTSTTTTTSSRPPRTTDDEPSSTRSRPRYNETRTLYPRP